MVADELPEVIAARVVERVEDGESAVEVSAWLVDLGYWATSEDVAVIVDRHRPARHRQTGQEQQRRDGTPGTEGMTGADGVGPR